MMRACDAAVEVLRETDNTFVMWGDEHLLHEIAERLGWEHQAWRTSARVLRVLSRTPGPLEKRKILADGHWVLMFRLPPEQQL